jgi:hypothetical protein
MATHKKKMKLKRFKWKKSSQKMENDLNIKKMEDDLNKNKNGR